LNFFDGSFKLAHNTDLVHPGLLYSGI
jgi:hypothetical protein